jgi:hypothetical protein
VRGRSSNAAKYFPALLADDKLADAARERAFHQDGDLRFRIRHKISIYISHRFTSQGWVRAAAEIAAIGFLARNTATMQGAKRHQLLIAVRVRGANSAHTIFISHRFTSQAKRPRIGAFRKWCKYLEF